MSHFEFTVTIVTIVIAFAISELMAGWGRIWRQPHRFMAAGPTIQPVPGIREFTNGPWAPMM